ncbi:MAG: HEAT repeat domain-containing protein [bacterium]|nr:HEAT repeat domain-containing protein [bacterium]
MNDRSKVILKTALAGVLFLCLAIGSVRAQGALERKVDSLFVIASSGSVKYRDLVDPAKDSLAALGADAVPFLIEKFTTKSARERWAIIHVLQRIGSPAVPDLVAALNREDPLVVQRVCWALGDIKDTAAVEGLLAIRGHTRWQVRDQAVGALGKIGDDRAVDAVMEAMTDTIGQVRKSAAVAAGRLTVGASVEGLVHMLGDDFYGARLSAFNSLLKLDTAKVTRVVADSLSSETELLGHLSCRLLGQFATDEAVDLLRIQLSSDSPSRRAQAAVALVRADPHDNCGYMGIFLSQEEDRLVLLKIQSALAAVSDEQ